MNQTINEALEKARNEAIAQTVEAFDKELTLAEEAYNEAITQARETLDKESLRVLKAYKAARADIERIYNEEVNSEATQS